MEENKARAISRAEVDYFLPTHKPQGPTSNFNLLNYIPLKYKL